MVIEQAQAGNSVLFFILTTLARQALKCTVVQQQATSSIPAIEYVSYGQFSSIPSYIDVL
jgi:hypothetical protein